MTVTIELSPDEERRLRERAARLGQDVVSYLHRLVRDDLEAVPVPGRRTFAEILAPVHDDFRRSGMTEAELEGLLDEAIRESRADRRRAEDGGA